ncbi:uncharacterized protein LOC143916716 isoform X2 [Arctopsyche grandis]|uniref:uncharacterized protein LOC143916716 isoform X2 n=1 Tax=Arctopsyche grandis TaxID=121162 RepID=UPI00406D6853
MECRLCLCQQGPAGSFVSIHDDPHPPQRLVQRIWTCCQLRVRKGDHLPDTICLSCLNNLELLDTFRNSCFRNDTTSRLELDKCLKVKPEEVLLEDLIWEDELGADWPPNISSSPDDGQTPGRKNTSRDNVAAIINMSIDSLALGNSVTMQRFSGADRSLCVQEFYKNGGSATVARRRFCSIRGCRHLNDAPSIPLIRKWVKKFEETGTMLDKPKSGRPRSSRTAENVESVNQSVRDHPNLSIRKRASALNMHRSSLHRILHKDSGVA